MDEPQSKWLRSLVNRHQTPEERRDKYLYLITSGIHCEHARRARDWTWRHVELLIINHITYPANAETAIQLRMLH